MILCTLHTLALSPTSFTHSISSLFTSQTWPQYCLEHNHLSGLSEYQNHFFSFKNQKIINKPIPFSFSFSNHTHCKIFSPLIIEKWCFLDRQFFCLHSQAYRSKNCIVKQHSACGWTRRILKVVLQWKESCVEILGGIMCGGCMISS